MLIASPLLATAFFFWMIADAPGNHVALILALLVITGPLWRYLPREAERHMFPLVDDPIIGERLNAVLWWRRASFVMFFVSMVAYISTDLLLHTAWLLEVVILAQCFAVLKTITCVLILLSDLAKSVPSNNGKLGCAYSSFIALTYGFCGSFALGVLWMTVSDLLGFMAFLVVACVLALSLPAAAITVYALASFRKTLRDMRPR